MGTSTLVIIIIFERSCFFPWWAFWPLLFAAPHHIIKWAHPVQGWTGERRKSAVTCHPLCGLNPTPKTPLQCVRGWVLTQNIPEPAWPLGSSQHSPKACCASPPVACLAAHKVNTDLESAVSSTLFIKLRCWLQHVAGAPRLLKENLRCVCL